MSQSHAAETSSGKPNPDQAAETQAAILNALPAHIALVDPDGVILEVNDSWKRFAAANVLRSADFGVGSNYLEICAKAAGECSESAEQASRGLRRVLCGEAPDFFLEYPCHSPTEKRWYRLMVTPVSAQRRAGVVVMHVNVTERRLAEEALRASEERLIEAQAVAQVGSWETDLADFAVRWSAQTHRIFETDPTVFSPTHAKFLAIVHPEDRAAVDRAFQQSLASGGINAIEHRLLMPDGRSKIVEERWQVFCDASAQPLRAVGTCRDITEKKQAAEVLQRSEALQRMAGRLARIGAWSINLKEMRSYWSDEVCAIHGVPAGHHVAVEDGMQFYVPEHRAIIAQDFANCAAEGRPFDRELQIINTAGKRVWVRVIGEAVRSEAGDIVTVQGAFQDTSELKAQEDRQRSLSERLVNTLESLSEGFFTLDRAWRFTYVNAAAEQVWGCTRSALLGRTLWDAFPGVIGTAFEREYRRALTENRVTSFEEYYPPFDGWYEVKAYPDSEGLAVYFRDVGERKRAEAALRASEEEFRILAEAMPQIVWVTRTDGWNVYFNRRWMDYTGMTLEESLGHGWNKPFHPDDQQRAWAAWQEATATGGMYSLECRLRRADGVYQWWLVRGVPQRGPSGEIVKWFGTCTDIDELKRAQVQIGEQAELINVSRDAIIVRDLDDRITFWSRGAERLYGWTSAEAQGQRMGDLLKPEPEKYREALAVVQRDGAWSGEIQKITQRGVTRTLDARWILLREPTGQPKSILATDTDITDRKKLEHQFLRAQRMESLGTLAGGIAHDLNNLLAPITMGVDLLKVFEPSPRSLPVIDNIERSAKRGADLVKQVLSFARGFEGSRVALQIRHVVKEVELIAQNTFPKNITVVSRLPAELWQVLADPTQLNQVILNLAVNARDAMPDGGRLELKAENLEIDAQYALMNRGLAPGRYVRIQATDTGCGIPQEIIDRIFEPFFTTKEMGKGTGLGLSTVIGIVRSHGGQVNVYSELGKGSTFSVYLPAHLDGGPSQTNSLVAEPLPRGDGELVLVVDDETSILEITKQTLSAFGYRVVTAEDGAHAISAYALQRDEIAVVLTDMMMPVMDGPAMIAALRRINPHVRVIGASGLNENVHAIRAAGAGLQYFLPKPYSADALLIMLRKILRTDPAGRP